jgi:surfeit locus 1 family protein
VTARLPIVPTIIVAAACAIMIALGFWQLGKVESKAALIASYEAVSEQEASAAFPFEGDGEDVLFRRSTVTCERVTGAEPKAGTAANGAKGWVARVTCVSASGPEVIVDLGFTRDLELPSWEGGEVTGIIAAGPRLVADPPVAGLYPLAKPDPRDLPNNHLSYAVQWFVFAFTAFVIYVLALRSRRKRKG